MVLVTGDTDDLYLHGKIYNIFDELTRISWSIVDGLIPTIEHRLNVCDEIDLNLLAKKNFSFSQKMKNFDETQSNFSLSSRVRRKTILHVDTKIFGKNSSISKRETIFFLRNFLPLKVQKWNDRNPANLHEIPEKFLRQSSGARKRS